MRFFSLCDCLLFVCGRPARRWRSAAFVVQIFKPNSIFSTNIQKQTRVWQTRVSTELYCIRLSSTILWRRRKTFCCRWTAIVSIKSRLPLAAAASTVAVVCLERYHIRFFFFFFGCDGVLGQWCAGNGTMCLGGVFWGGADWTGCFCMGGGCMCVGTGQVIVECFSGCL